MILNLLLGALIFGYAAFTLFRFVKKSRQGKCSACSMKDSCSSICSQAEMESLLDRQTGKKNLSC
jgi:radical SAM protein with 4Fe4S-binding SPASM domain